MQQLSNNRAPGFDCIQMKLLRPIPPAAIKVICQRSGKSGKVQKIGKGQFLYQYQRKVMQL